MKLYRRDDMDPDEGCCVSWHTSRRAAERAKPFEGGYLESIEAVDVPTNRRRLVAWLNRNLKRDNG